MRFLLRARWVCLTIVAALTASNLPAAQPRFTQISPRGVQRGTEADLVLTGTNLEDAEELLLADRGLEVVSFAHPEDEKLKGKQVRVRVKIAPDCPLGSQRLWIRARSGLSDIQNLYVGALPIAAEKEPNTDFATPQPIEKNVTIEGRVDREDVDYFVLDAKQGERLTAEVFGMRLGATGPGTYFDPYVAILDENRKELAASDDTVLVHNDAVASIIVPQDGKYYVQIRDAAYFGDGRSYYLLSVGNFPRPQATIPSGGKPGEKLTVTFVGDVKGPITREVTLPAEPSESYALEVQDEFGFAPSSMPFRVTDLPNVLEQEPNNDHKTATAGEAPVAYNGVIGEAGDIDYFKFTGKKDQRLGVRVIARDNRTPLDAFIHIYNAANGQRLAGNDDTAGKQDSYVDFKVPADGEYAVAIHDQLRRGGEIFAYRIEVSPISPSVDAQPIDIARYVQPKIEIPQGSGSGVVVTVRRGEFGGPVEFLSDALPPGVRVECPENWRGGGQMPIVFYADADAPLSGKFSPVTVRPVDQNIKVSGLVSQDILMIRGRNQDRVWQERFPHLPIVVTQKLPFRVWIEQPAVPVVRGGPLNLIVKCEKDEGWDEDIQVLLLQNPSGISSSTSAKIPKGQTEGVIPINAAGNAAVQEAMIAVRCIAKVGNGNVECCTAAVPLRVAEQYLQLEFAQGAVQQGQELAYSVKVNKRQDFEGEAELQLLGLPANATAEPQKVTKDTTEVTFTIKAAANTPPGMSKNLFCQAQVPEAGTHITHNLGTGVLRVDPPPPPKKDAPPTPAPAPVVAQEKPAKPLSRLEQLRQQAKEKEEAAKSGGSGGE